MSKKKDLNITKLDNNMNDEKSSIFIGSSSKGLDVARAIKSQFDRDYDVDIWSEGVFKLNQSYLESLLNAASLYDFAILVLTPDDLIKSKGKSEMTPRDNVIFEVGLFLGRLGPRRAFIICEESVKILSDFSGIKIATFRHRDDGNMVSAVGNACNEIRNEIEQSSKQSELSLLPSTALAIGYYENFVSKVYDCLVDRNCKYKIKIDGKLRDDIRYDSFSLTIIIPDKLSYLESKNLKSIFLNKNLIEIVVETPYRDFPFFIRGNIEKEKTLDLFDIPTTLLASQKAIELIRRKTFLGEEPLKLKLEKREIHNFKMALEFQLNESGEEVKKYIKIANPSYLDRK